MVLVGFGFPGNNQIEGDAEYDIADVAEEVVEVEKKGGVQKRVLAPGVEVADVVVARLQQSLLSVERCLEDGDRVEDADQEQVAHEQLVLLVTCLRLFRIGYHIGSLLKRFSLHRLFRIETVFPVWFTHQTVLDAPGSVVPA